MAEQKGQQGTGRHPHKSTEEPWPHTKEQGTQHGRSRSEGGSDNRSHGDGGNRSQDQGREAAGREQSRDEAADLKRREYVGADGETHHHTRTYMEQHGQEESGGQHGGGQHGGDRQEVCASGVHEFSLGRVERSPPPQAKSPSPAGTRAIG